MSYLIRILNFKQLLAGLSLRNIILGCLTNSHSFTEWFIASDNKLFFSYIEKILYLIANEEKSV